MRHTQKSRSRVELIKLNSAAAMMRVRAPNLRRAEGRLCTVIPSHPTLVARTSNQQARTEAQRSSTHRLVLALLPTVNSRAGVNTSRRFARAHSFASLSLFVVHSCCAAARNRGAQRLASRRIAVQPSGQCSPRALVSRAAESTRCRVPC